MPHETFRQYESAVNRLLLDFQRIEMTLRIVVGASYEVLSRAAPAPVCFQPSRAKLARDALGRLIERYSEVSANTVAVEKLKSVLKHRNYCAHQSFILTVDEQRSAEFIQSEVSRMSELREETRSLVLRLQDHLEVLARVLKESPGAVAAREWNAKIVRLTPKAAQDTSRRAPTLESRLSKKSSPG